MSIQINFNISNAAKHCDTLLSYGDSCKVFFEKHAIKSQMHRGELERDQFAAYTPFAALLQEASKNQLEEYKKNLSPSSDSQELITLSTKIAECEKVMDCFQTAVVQLLQNKPSAWSHPKDKTHTFMKLAGFDECNCMKNVFRTNREDFTEELVNKISKCFSNKMQITIASIGAGGCFHELTIHAALKKSSRGAHWQLIDMKEIPKKTIASFQMIGQWVDSKTTTTFIQSLAADYFENLKTQPIKPDVFLFIDCPFLNGEKIRDLGKEMRHPCLFALLGEAGNNEEEGTFIPYCFT